MARISPLLAAILTTGMALVSCGDDITNKPPIEYDREVVIPGLEGKVSAFYDVGGVLHLECETDLDCLTAQGYFHAADRFFQMDLRRRFAQGRLSELVGAIVLDIDHRQRTLLMTAGGASMAQKMWDAADAQTQSAVTAYAAGVNAWIEDLRNQRNGARLAEEYDFSFIDKTRIEDWTEIDSISCFLPVVLALTNSSGRDLQAGAAMDALGTEMANDLFGVRTPSSSAIAPTATAAAQAGKARSDLSRWSKAIEAARRFLPPPQETEGLGSNNWIVGPSKAAGQALLANDPHLTLSNAAIWYLVHIDAKTRGRGELHIAGASFAGVPGILFGHNEDLAWGVTTTFFDQSDVYLETLNEAGDAVLFEDGEVAIDYIDVSYAVKDQEEPTLRQVAYVPHHGPILSIDTQAQTATSLRWSGQDAETDYNFLWKMWTAQNVDAAQEALRSVSTVGQNFVVADRDGDIGWFPYNNIPRRPWNSESPAWLPLPGDGSAEWGAYLDYDELPQSKNPTAGYLATANNDMSGDLYDGISGNQGQQALQHHVAPGYRHERISELLAESDAHTLEDMQRIQHDTKSLIGEKVTPLVLADLESASLSPAAQSVHDALAAWDFFCPTGFANADPNNPEPSESATELASARGCAAFHVLWPRLRRATFADEIAAKEASLPIRDEPMLLAFLRPETLSQEYWDDLGTEELTETRADIVASAVEDAAIFLSDKLGSDAQAWLWGALHRVYLPADLFEDAGVTDYSYGPWMNAGGIATVDVAAPRNDAGDNYDNVHGASIRLACSLGNEVQCTYELPGGQRHHRSDMSFYQNLLVDWLARTPRPLVFSTREVQPLAAESIRLVNTATETE